MRPLKTFGVIGAAALLASCDVGPQDSIYGGIDAVEADYEYVAAPTAPRMAADVQAAPTDTAETPATDGGGTFLAYIYTYGFSLPSSAVTPVMERHMQTCLDAGPALCQVLGSSTQAFSETNVSANLSLRAAPNWLETFGETVQKDVVEADGDIQTSSVSVEDLTRRILDTDARLQAQITLRERLISFLETRDAELKDLLELERELARVQGEIESATSTLKVLRQRVSMSVMNLSYSSQSVAVSRSAFAPVARAMKSFVGDMMRGLAYVIEFFAAILPWLIFVILPGLWFIRWLWRRRGGPVRKVRVMDTTVEDDLQT